MSKITLSIEYECTLAHEGEDCEAILLEKIDSLLCGVIKNDDQAVIGIVEIEHIWTQPIEYGKVYTRPVNR